MLEYRKSADQMRWMALSLTVKQATLDAYWIVEGSDFSDQIEACPWYAELPENPWDPT